MKKLSIASLSAGAFSLMMATQTFAEGVGTGFNLCPGRQVNCSFQSDPGLIVNNVLNFIFVAAAVVAVVFLIWGGIKWITAGGDKTKVQSARDTIIGAIIGLVVAFAAFFIINFVLKILFGASIEELQFDAIFK